MYTKLIGLGAGGNKAAICAVKNQVIEMSNVMLVNSTLKDIPKDYDGVMGVPVTFIDKYNPDQFEIIGLMNSFDIGIPYINNKALYARVLIKRKK